MGAIGWGHVAPPLFSDGGEIIFHVSHIFIFRYCIWRGSKDRSDVCHVLCEELFVLDFPHSQVDVETVWCGITDSDIFMNFSFDKMIFSILQVSRDRERSLTASVRNFTLYGIL